MKFFSTLVLIILPLIFSCNGKRSGNYNSYNKEKKSTGKVIAIISEGDDIIPSMADDFFVVPLADEIVAPIISVIPLQLLSYYIGVLKGCDVDKPRNLAKSVTVE